jgi:hypothetical protein
VTSVHGHSVLDLAVQPLEANFALPLVHEIATENDRAMLDVAVAAEMNLIGDTALIAAEAAREAGNSPNTVMAAAAAIIGPRRVERALACSRALIDLFAHSGLADSRDEAFDFTRMKVDARTRALFLSTSEEAADPRPEAMLKAVHQRGGRSLFLAFLENLGGRPSRDAILAAIATTIAWGPLMRKRISRLTAEMLPWYLRLYGVMIGASIPAKYHQHGSLWGISREERFGRWTMADFLFLALTGKKPRGGGAAATEPDRPSHLQRTRFDHCPGRQGRGRRRRAANARPGADQQGDDRLPHPQRLQPRRQRLRGHGLHH